MDEPADADAPAAAAPDGGDPAIAPTVPGRRAALATGSDPQATWDLPDADRASVPASLGPGAAVGRFVLRAPLGAGGMGVVFAADDPDLGRQVAVKLVRDDAAPALRARLLREAQAMARLEHPNVVRVFEVGQADGRLFVAMELVDGQTLSQWLRASAHGWRAIVTTFVEIGAGLAAVHAAGLVHRDFKPDNVLVDRGGHARVADFGLARFDGGATSSPALAAPLTRTGAMMGTPGYMAPEQQFGADVDARADQYSFCVALREALGAGWATAPKPVRAAVTRGLSYDPSERFPTLGALLGALERTITPRRGVWIVGGAIALAAASAGTVALVASRGPVIEREAGLREAPVVAHAVIVDGGLVPGPTELARRIVDDNDAMVRARVAAITPDAGAPDAPRARAVDPQPAPHAGPGPDDQRTTVDPAHLDAVRAAIRDLGYQGLDAGGDLAAAETALRQAREASRAAGGLDYGVASVKLGMVRRRRGDCRQARAIWHDAEPVFKSLGQDEMHWEARAWLGSGLCQLAAGNAAAAQNAIEYATTLYDSGNANTKDDYDEAVLALAIIEWERGDKYTLFHMERDNIKTPRTRALLDAWAQAVGAP